MKKFWIILLLSWMAMPAFAQINLVPNPSFEDTVACPDNFNQVSNAVGWLSTRLSPDYFNACASQTLTPVSVPSNYWGFQNAVSGHAYVGFTCYGVGNVRECIGTNLISPLQIGVKYFISIKACLALDNVGPICATNKLGAFFSTISYTSNNQVPICNCPQVYTDSIISDTLNWTRINMSFTADSAYSFVSIGNFFVDSLTNFIIIHGSNCFSYNYVDDVCISTDSLYCYTYFTGLNNLNSLDQIKIYPNPFSDYIILNNEQGDIDEIQIFNSIGQLSFYLKCEQTSNLKLDLSILPYGIYSIKLIKNKLITKSQLIIKIKT